ncbi:MAG: RluA family pseudouridine synthase [Lachnospiraceae bacterium]|nr:RluA family pseudouridine synthase [Lachnospiraceae bacterium]
MIERFVVSEEYEGLRADKYLSLIIGDRSRSYLQKLIKEGKALLNGASIKPSFAVSAGDELVLDLPESELPAIVPEDIPLDIVYEDADLLVVNKPKGMVVHPAPGHYSGTLVNALMYHCRDLSGINGVLRPGIVHRIDRDTTGLLIVCKNDKSHASIAEQLQKHSCRRIYHALAKGVFKDSEGCVDAPIGRDDKDRKLMCVKPGGKHAVTHYKLLEQFRDRAYISCELETGRTHQIRVHMKHIGHPLMGDEIYGGPKIKSVQGQVLHAKTIGFVHPSTGEEMFFDSELPEYFRELIASSARV